ncbi:hypothetical protein SAMN06265365_108170 [Tistlia consotensis]|uniref:Uncharacterized protein n=1 Tax=Tistlia consotensis USBA 355 TaxID=560819 RepID=A0A1Y6BQU8_9PROT|nr:hypothetical protein [Tistlia consotensis]SMF23436.1 hypothetical protein SAMN05428998_10810 [Tistlia consotensis USBA 355]SNR61653.1 hypothetical protein SAMN06265365_108170 [Tistlia consotensis]
MASSYTIGELLTEGYTVHGFCFGCGTGRPLDLAAIAARRGRQLQLLEMKRRLRCTVCRGRVEICLSS